jgi:hypothetical protein
VLILPPESSDPGPPGRLDDRHQQRLAADLAVGLLPLPARDPEQSRVGHRLHISVTQEIE